MTVLENIRWVTKGVSEVKKNIRLQDKSLFCYNEKKSKLNKYSTVTFELMKRGKMKARIRENKTEEPD